MSDPNVRFRQALLMLPLLLAAVELNAATNRIPIVESIARQISERYVLVDDAVRIANRLRERARSGAYDGFATDMQFAQTLTKELREDDLHFDVVHDPKRAQVLLAAGTDKSKQLPDILPSPEELREMREGNYGFQRAEILAGNVALLDIRRFFDLEYSADAATAALRFVGSSDAVIVDLRQAPGGWPSSTQFFLSHFLEPSTPLLAAFDREKGETTRGQTLGSVPGPRRVDVPLFVLVGPGTASAAEAVAFALQLLGRATLVGERTAGAAQGGGWVPVGEGFIVFIPNFRAFDPRTGKSWERVGVQPDVVVPVHRALEHAHLHAVAVVERKSPSRKTRWLLPVLDLAANGSPKVTLGGLADKYEGIEVKLTEGGLTFLGASGVLRTLTPLSDGTFLIEDASIAAEDRNRLRFTRDAKGNVTGLDLLSPAGGVYPRPRVPGS